MQMLEKYQNSSFIRLIYFLHLHTVSSSFNQKLKTIFQQYTMLNVNGQHFPIKPEQLTTKHTRCYDIFSMNAKDVYEIFSPLSKNMWVPWE